MRNIEVTAKTVDQAIEKGLQMLGVNREDIEYKVINEGSMLKKALVEIYTFANAEEREDYQQSRILSFSLCLSPLLCFQDLRFPTRNWAN